MARISASQIALLKQLFTQIGSSIEVDQVNGADNWFVNFFNALGPSLVTDQGTAAAAAAAAAQVSADAAQADATSALTKLASRQAGVVGIDADQTISTPYDIAGLVATVTVSEEVVFLVRADVNVEYSAGAKFYLKLNLDGVTNALYRYYESAGAASDRCVYTWAVTVPAGTHTINLWGVSLVADTVVKVKDTQMSWWQV